MQTILGAGGVIGTELARILPEFTDRVRLVGRNPKAVEAENEVFPADLLDGDAVRRAVGKSEVVYLVAGLPYKARVWAEQWPKIMQNVIGACSRAESRLVFFDNVYMYDRDFMQAMDENTPVRPCSRKGEVRARIADMLMQAIGTGEVAGLIARSADFYGPGRQQSSMLTQLVCERLAAGKRAQWLLSADYRHSFTHTSDAARGTAMLGNSEAAYGETWHLPTAPAPPTGNEWVAAVAARMNQAADVRIVSKSMLALAGLVVPLLRELKEMAYQYDRDYVFLSDKFEQRFDFRPTPYEQATRAMVEADYL